MTQVVYGIDFLILHRKRELGHKWVQIIEEDSPRGHLLALAHGRRRVLRIVTSLTGFSPDDLVVIGQVLDMQPYPPHPTSMAAAHPCAGNIPFVPDGYRAIQRQSSWGDLPSAELSLNADAVFCLDDPGRS